jgi:uncharacterized OB-fold protein
MSEARAVADWTQGAEGVAYQSCTRCAAVWYFARTFCPACGAPAQWRQAAGTGTVYARTLVTRAPSDDLRAHAPYLIVLVDADERFRLMAHGDPALEIGDRVRCRFVDFGGRRVPWFERGR